jgi:phospholipase C
LDLFLLFFISTASASSPNAHGDLKDTYIDSRPQSWQNIKHIVLIIFENNKAADTLGEPFFKLLTTKGAYLNQSFATIHPSQPNYFSLIAGSTLGVLTDLDVDLPYEHLGNLLNKKGLTWKAYAEDLPYPCFKGPTSGNYVRKHEPFISFTNVQNDPNECAKIVPGVQFFFDIIGDQLPSFSLYIPNMQNDGHDTNIAFANNWFRMAFGPIFNNPKVMSNTLFIVTFDEDNFLSFNHIYTCFIGAAVSVGTESNRTYNHYNVLRTIEEIYQTGTLGRLDSLSLPITDIWQA